jgi:hypothetical protein
MVSILPEEPRIKQSIECEAATIAPIPIFSEWLFWWLFLRPFVTCVGLHRPSFQSAPFLRGVIRRNPAVILPAECALGR